MGWRRLPHIFRLSPGYLRLPAIQYALSLSGTPATAMPVFLFHAGLRQL